MIPAGSGKCSSGPHGSVVSAFRSPDAHRWRLPTLKYLIASLCRAPVETLLWPLPKRNLLPLQKGQNNTLHYLISWLS